jgi:hypothetical protein
MSRTIASVLADLDGILVTRNTARAERIIPELESTDSGRLGHDSSTNALIGRYRARREVTP